MCKRCKLGSIGKFRLCKHVLVFGKHFFGQTKLGMYKYMLKYERRHTFRMNTSGYANVGIDYNFIKLHGWPEFQRLFQHR